MEKPWFVHQFCNLLDFDYQVVTLGTRYNPIFVHKKINLLQLNIMLFLYSTKYTCFINYTEDYNAIKI